MARNNYDVGAAFAAARGRRRAAPLQTQSPQFVILSRAKNPSGVRQYFLGCEHPTGFFAALRMTGYDSSKGLKTFPDPLSCHSCVSWAIPAFRFESTKIAGRLLRGGPKNHSHSQRGFALIITLALLALLVLAVVALATLVKVGGQVSAASAYQVQAKQNALVGLNVGLGELQRHAGDDTRITGMAGITGIAANAGNSTRHWCGVWRSDGTFVAWLISGAQGLSTAALQNGVADIELVSAGSVGAPAANSEHVIAGKVPIVVSETPGTPGVATTIGHYAFLVSDEGVKTPASSPAPFPVVAPVIFANATNAQSRLRDALAAHASNVPKVLSYEQLAVLPSPALTPSTLQDNFHHITLASRTLNGNQLYGGMLNVNTNSAIVWRNVLQTYNTVPGIPAAITSATVSARGTTIQNSLPAFATAGKSPNGPFTSVASFGNYLTTVFPATGSPTAAQVMTTLGPMLTMRSDTFRIRAYGEALNPADPTKIEATAYCEAIVQRTNELVPNGLGRKFVILNFRWLGPDDIYKNLVDFPLKM